MISTAESHPLLTRLLIATAALLLSATAGSSGADWELQIEEPNISIYTRSIEGSPFHEVRGTANIYAPVTRVAELMGDGNGCVEWRAMCESSEVIEEVSEHERYVYVVIDMPWPASDRDMVLHSTTSVDPETFSATVDLSPASSRHPPGDYIRAESSGQFLIKALGPEEVEFTLIMHTDLGGDLPVGAVNSRLADGVLDDLRRLVKLAEG